MRSLNGRSCYCTHDRPFSFCLILHSADPVFLYIHPRGACGDSIVAPSFIKSGPPTFEILPPCSAARLITGARRCQQMSPILSKLHWLSIRQRILFKTAVFVYKYLLGRGMRAHTYLPTYLHSWLCVLKRKYLRNVEIELKLL